jgi:hypothetical protein
VAQTERRRKNADNEQRSETPQGALGRSLAMAAAAWAVPGLGHLLLGKRLRALLFCGLVLVALAVGCSLDGNLYRVLPDRPLTLLATFASMGTGLPYFVLRFLTGYHGDVVSPHYEYGTAFVLTAGLMNLLLVLDAWDIARGVKD